MRGNRSKPTNQTGTRDVGCSLGSSKRLCYRERANTQLLRVCCAFSIREHLISLSISRYVPTNDTCSYKVKSIVGAFGLLL